MAEVEVINDTRRCSQIAGELKSYAVISVDAEGINLGKEGPLTLLQVGTPDQKVYLFDVWTDKMLLKNRQMREILESSRIVKVMQSCREDSAALYFQFNILLKNVFDIQVAHLVIEEHKGWKLPKTLKMAEICKRYSKNAEVFEQKDSVKIKFVKEVGDFWAQRPLTKEMIDYASGDVTAIIPEVFETQKEYIAKNGLDSYFNDRMYEEVNFYMDPLVQKKKHQRQDEVVKKIIEELPKKYSSVVNFEDITNEDDLRAIKTINYKTPKMHPIVVKLKTEAIKLQLKELADQLSTEGEGFVPKQRSFGFLGSFQHHPDGNINREASRIQKRLNVIFLNDIARKYLSSTELKCIAQCEKEALKSLRPKGENDFQIHPVQLALYWKNVEEELDCTINDLNKKGKEYTITEGFYKMLRFWSTSSVPESVQNKAKAHVRNMDSCFGKNVVPKR